MDSESKEVRSRLKSKKDEPEISENGPLIGDGDPNSTEATGWGSESIILQLDSHYTKCLAICASRNSPYGWLRPLMKALEMSCHGIPWLVFAAWGILYSTSGKHRTLALNLMSALTFDLMVVGLVKTIARRPRPQHNEMDMFFTVSVDNFSFPSGHTTRAAMLMYFSLDQIALPGYAAFIVIAWSVCVSLSRVMLGRHHIIDIISGFIIGITQYAVLRSFFWIEPSRAESIVTRIQQYFGLLG